MKRTALIVAALVLMGASSAFAQNYDKSKIPPYTLEDPLTFVNGKKVRNARDWEARRAEILEIFQNEMYGRMPENPETVVTEVIEEGTTLAGFATRRQIRMWFKADKTGPKIDWLVVTPNFTKGPVPTVLLLNYTGNHTVLFDEEVLVNPGYRLFANDPTARGSQSDPNLPTGIPAAQIIGQGYALVTACYEDVSPDPDPATEEEKEMYAYTRVFDLWGPRDPERTDNTTALTSWAWGLRRGMDLIEKDPQLDQSRVLLTGYSRLAKAALIAAAFDQRFPVVVTNQTGGGGVPLQKHFYGENAETMNRTFSHWYCKGYRKYAGNEANLHFDQHLFVSCIAPRAILVEGFDNPWYDTEAEYLCLKAASPVWKKIFHKPGLPDVSWPDDYDTRAIGPVVGYVRRDLEHGIAPVDWKWMFDFAAGIFDNK
ncbi:MAG: hypothetical protein MJY91_07960 [Bacteroidales bacterium]|nr:hypothetical protein [Bacteroidales bacterium]